MSTIIIHTLQMRKSRLRFSNFAGLTAVSDGARGPTQAKPRASHLPGWATLETPISFLLHWWVLDFVPHLPSKQWQCSREEAYLSSIVGWQIIAKSSEKDWKWRQRKDNIEHLRKPSLTTYLWAHDCFKMFSLACVCLCEWERENQNKKVFSPKM